MAGKKTGKRLLTWVLVLVMALSLLPLNALAEEADEAAALQMSDEDNSDDRSLMPAKTTYTLTFDATTAASLAMVIRHSRRHIIEEKL